MQSIANFPVIGLDLAKSVFQLHIVDTDTGEIQRRQIKRAKLTEFFAKRQRSLVAMEACGTSHHWARVILSLGHEVKMLPALHSIQDELATAQQKNLFPSDLVVSVQEQLKRINGMQDDIEHIGERLRTLIREDRQMRAIQQIPGVGELTASALVGAVGDFTSFKSGRHLAAWVGLTPRQVGTGGKTQQLGISKRGDSYLRTLLIAGARAVIVNSEKSSWITRLLERRPYNVVVVALANKIARTAWAILAKGAAFDQLKWNPVEQVEG